jgi:hypothetical protein
MHLSHHIHDALDHGIDGISVGCERDFQFQLAGLELVNLVVIGHGLLSC